MMYSAVQDLVLHVCPRSNRIAVRLVQEFMGGEKCQIFTFLKVTPFHSLLNITLPHTRGERLNQLESTIPT